MSLLELLKQQKPESTAIAGSEAITYGELVRDAVLLRKKSVDVKDGTVAVNYKNLREFLTSICALDGYCQNLYLLPDSKVIPKSVPNCKSLTVWPDNKVIQVNNECRDDSVGTSRWFIATSGTTSSSKWIEHTFSSLTEKTKSSERLSALRWGLLYQPFRFAGLQVILQALTSGASILDLLFSGVKEKLSLMESYGVSALSATPGMWRQILMGDNLSELSLTHITLGGEIVDQPLLNRLHQVFPLAQIRHIYASTEAGVGFIVSDGEAGFPSAWLGNRNSISTPMFIDDEQHLRIKPATVSNTVLSAYGDQNGFIDTQDLVEVKGSRVLFLGRASGIINVGGNKVHPERIEQTIIEVDGVMGIHVYGKRNSVLGQLVHADVVISSGECSVYLKKDIIEYCKSKLNRYEIPATIRFVDSLTMTPAGKLRRETTHA